MGGSSLGCIGILISPVVLRRSILALSASVNTLYGVSQTLQTALSFWSGFHAPQFLHLNSEDISNSKTSRKINAALGTFDLVLKIAHDLKQ